LREVRFTVVVPAFNAAHTIGSAIRSVLAQTAEDFELLIVDDGSTDGTSDAVRAVDTDSRVRMIRQANKGPSAARNRAIAEARGAFVSMLDADDLWLPEYLEVMGAALDANAEAPFSYTDAWLLDDQTRRVRRRSAMSSLRAPEAVTDARALLLELLQRNFIYTSTTSRRSVLEAVGGYDETLGTGEDWDLWLRIVRRGLLPVRVPGLLAIHRHHASSLTSDSRTMIRNACEICRRFIEDPAVDEEMRRVAIRRLDNLTRSLERLEEQPLLERARARARAAKGRVFDRWVWLRRRPEAVERTLRAVGEIG
jgi:glycosyltransferase involved in cell wall biosynthesis